MRLISIRQNSKNKINTVMKRSLSILTLMAVAILCGCSKFASGPERSPASISIDVSMDSEPTKAAIDGDGNAANVNRCILQIWKGDELFKTVVKTAPAGTREYSFRGVTLDPEESYDFLFWADCGTAEGGDLYYSTESLRNVVMLHPDRGNDDAMDAFCNHILGGTADSEYPTRLILRRPLAQLNVITLDLQQLAKVPMAEGFYPERVSFGYYGCTGYDVRENKTVGEASLIQIKDHTVYGKTDKDGARTLAMSYLFPQDGESVSTVSLEIQNTNGTSVTGSFSNIPLKSNWRTNIYGRHMTAAGEFSVLVDPMFDGEIDWNPFGGHSSSR